MPNGGLSATSGSGKHHRRINSAETVALSLLSFRPDAQQAEPRVSDLEWLVGDGDTPQEVRYVALVKRPVVRFILQGERPDFQSCCFYIPGAPPAGQLCLALSRNEVNFAVAGGLAVQGLVVQVGVSDVGDRVWGEHGAPRFAGVGSSQSAAHPQGSRQEKVRSDALLPLLGYQNLWFCSASETLPRCTP